MATETVNVPDGKTLFPYFVDTADVTQVLDDWAWTLRVKTDADGDYVKNNKGVRIDDPTVRQMAKIAIIAYLTKGQKRIQKRKQRQSAAYNLANIE